MLLVLCLGDIYIPGAPLQRQLLLAFDDFLNGDGKRKKRERYATFPTMVTQKSKRVKDNDFLSQKRAGRGGLETNAPNRDGVVHLAAKFSKHWHVLPHPSPPPPLRPS